MELGAANERIEMLERENKILRDELVLLKQGLFGKKSERLDPGQLDLYLNGTAGTSVLPQDTAPIVPPPRHESTTVKNGHGRQPQPAKQPGPFRKSGSG